MANKKVGAKTGKSTQAGRDVYKTEDGENVSEKSTTFKYKGQWINVPSIHKGYQYDDDILRMMLDAEVISPTSTHKSESDAVKAAVERSKSLKFNEGGDVAAQTEEALGWTAEGKKFADENPVEVTEEEQPDDWLSTMSISNVPFFKRPMDASESDRWTGSVDEAGNKEYRTVLGGTYFVKPAADQRTGREKIEQDVVPVVKDYLANPTAPSREQIIDFLKGSLGDAWETFSIPGKLLSGEMGAGEVTFGDVFGLAGGTGAASLPAKVPEGSLRSFGGSNPPTYEPRQKSLFYQSSMDRDNTPQEYLDILNTKLLMFREPIAEFASNVNIPKKGLLGSQFLDLIKKNDSIPEASLQEGIIEPSKRYTKEELLSAVSADKYRGSTFNSVANIASDKPKSFEDFQRQGKDAGFEGGSEVEYFDIPLSSSIGYPGKDFKANNQHYDDDTIVHVRGSIIDPSGTDHRNKDFLLSVEGDKYLLVEEIQSDLLTKGYIKPKNKFESDFSNAVSDYSRFRMVSYGEAFGSIDKEIKSVFKELDIDIPKPTADLIDNLLDDGVSLSNNSAFTPKEKVAVDGYLNLIQEKLTAKKINKEIDLEELDSIYQSYLNNKKISDAYPNDSSTGLPPIRKNKQAVDEALKVLIAKAAASGVSRIVIPPAERIALARGRDLKKEKGDRFYRTYVTDLEKSLSELEANYPVKISNVELPYLSLSKTNAYVDDGDPFGMMQEPVGPDEFFNPGPGGKDDSTLGTIINISDLIDLYKVEEPRQFAQGGVVNDMNKQMNLFARGGLGDDGMTRDPVSGNEIPPGSMAEEVRDDIPAQLSEGEYVVPADVVRFFGVKYFEDLRMEAKMGLSNMEANGRIGGEPVEPQMAQAGDPSEITDEDLAQLEQMLSTGVANGGLMDKLVFAAKNDQVINQRLNAGGVVVGYAGGGQVSAPTASYADPNRVDAVINQVMAAIQQKPELLQELSKRGIQVSRTDPNMQPQQMDQANPPQEATSSFAEGGYSSSDPGLPSWATTLGGSYMQPAGSVLPPVPAVAPVVGTAPPAASTGPSSVAESCAAMGMDFDPITGTCVLRSTDNNGSGDGGMAPPEPVEFEFKEPDTNYFEMSKEQLLAIGTGSEVDPFVNKGIAALGVVSPPLGVVFGAFNSIKQGQTIAEIRTAALVAQSKGFKDEAEALNKQADKLIGSANLLVQGANSFGGLSGHNDFAQQLASFSGKDVKVTPEMFGDNEKAYKRALEALETRKSAVQTVAPKKPEPVAVPNSTAPSAPTNTATLRAERTGTRSANQDEALQRAQNIKAKADAAGGSVFDYVQSTGGGSNNNTVSESDEAAINAGATVGPGGVYGMNKGGLMKKPKKK